MGKLTDCVIETEKYAVFNLQEKCSNATTCFFTNSSNFILEFLEICYPKSWYISHSQSWPRPVFFGLYFSYCSSTKVLILRWKFRFRSFVRLLPWTLIPVISHLLVAMVRWDLILVFCASGCHIFLGVFSVCLGVILSIQAEVWLAHSVSPIWSGGIVSLTYVCLVSEY